MPYYLIQASYSAQSVAALVKNPQDRSTVVRPVVERAGGKLHGMWFAFGDYDVVAIVELPDNVTSASLALAIGATGAMSNFRTTALLTMAEAVEAMKKAGDAGYKAPR